MKRLRRRCRLEGDFFLLCGAAAIKRRWPAISCSGTDALPDSKLINKKFTRRLLHRNCCLPCMSLFPNPLRPQRRRCRRHIRCCSSFSPCLSELLYERTPLPPIVRAWVSRRDKDTVSRTSSLSDALKNQPLAELSREDLVKGWGQPTPGSSCGGGGIRKSYLVLPYFPNGHG